MLLYLHSNSIFFSEMRDAFILLCHPYIHPSGPSRACCVQTREYVWMGVGLAAVDGSAGCVPSRRGGKHEVLLFWDLICQPKFREFRLLGCVSTAIIIVDDWGLGCSLSRLLRQDYA